MPHPKISFSQIESAACAYYGIHPLELRNKIRNQKSARRRYAVIHVARVHTALSLTSIARRVNFKDHTSVLYGQRRAGELLEHVPAFAQDIAALEEILAHTAAPSLQQIQV